LFYSQEDRCYGAERLLCYTIQMRISIGNKSVVVSLSPLEKLLSFRFTDIVIPYSSIRSFFNATPPHTTWNEFRFPGSFLPRVIKAGTFYSSRGKEFWYVSYFRSPFYLTVELNDSRYDRIILSNANVQNIGNQLQAAGVARVDSVDPKTYKPRYLPFSGWYVLSALIIIGAITTAIIAVIK
jgi:hypothetical protein